MKLPQVLIIESAEENIADETARLWIKDNLCLEKDLESCNKCQSCTSFDHQNHPDFIEVKRPEDKKNIPVELIRDGVISKINSKPLLSSISVVLINEADSLSNGAQNALLKTLEEPPSYLRIVLTVKKASNLLETIRSRSHVYTIQPSEEFLKSDLSLLNKIVNLNLSERFMLAKEISDLDKEGERKDSFNSISFLDNLLKDLRLAMRNYYPDEIFKDQVLKDINKLLEDRKKILYNANKLLVIENLLLQTIPSDIYKKHLVK